MMKDDAKKNAPAIREITENRKDYLDLLLLADEQESMIDLYLERGDMFALFDGDLRTVCVVTDEGGGVCELKNIATVPEHQGFGYATQLIDFISRRYSSRFSSMRVGTGDVPGILRFYERCGFSESHRVKDFFLDHYDHPMFDSGVQLVDMVYLSKDLRRV